DAAIAAAVGELAHPDQVAASVQPRHERIQIVQARCGQGGRAEGGRAGEGTGEVHVPRAVHRDAVADVAAAPGELLGPDEVAAAVQLRHEHAAEARAGDVAGEVEGAGAGVEVHGPLERAGGVDVPRAVHREGVRLPAGDAAAAAELVGPDEVAAAV